MAHTEVHILNFNGKKYLNECLRSLRGVKRDTHTVTINVVDNCSTDDSEQFVTEYFPEVNFIKLDKNYGFSGGNNRGVWRRNKELKKEGRKADYHVFLNNDTAVDEYWLLNAVDALEKNAQVGIVGSKALFYDKFIVIDLVIEDSFNPSDYGSLDTRELGIVLEGGIQGENIYTDFKRSKVPLAYDDESGSRWLPKRTRFYVAIIDPSKESTVRLQLRSIHPERSAQRFKLFDAKDGNVITEGEVVKTEPRVLSLSISPRHYVNVINNAGSFVKQNWEVGDIGMLEIDKKQYEEPRYVDAVCGVSLFIRDSVFKKINGFDEHYFAYFEDTDLSIRARLLGYDCLYVPNSVLRHIHCGSSGEFSEYFNINVTYSHLIFLSKLTSISEWRKRKRKFKQYAKEEYMQFKRDETLLGKPNLRAYFRYLKRMPRFFRNRISAFVSNPSRLFST
jgi:O-antigen biosynthesis protein